MKTQTLKIVLLTIVSSLVFLNTSKAEIKALSPMRTKACTGITTVLDLSPVSDFCTEPTSISTIDETPSAIQDCNKVEEGKTVEKPLQIESWMTNDQLFRFVGIYDQKLLKEKPLEIESWMTDQESWKL